MTIPRTPSPALVEVCCGSPEMAAQAEAAGADRVELCADLVEGGTTPSLGAMQATRAAVSIPVMAMIRPRGGDFLPTPGEVDVMLRDIEAARGAGMDGVVFGALTPEGRVDRAVTSRLVAAARPLPVTFHRAFDLSRDLDESLETLLDLGVERVLTSAGSTSALEEPDRLSRLIQRAGRDLTVMPCGGIRAENVAALLAVRGVREIHVGASRMVPSEMRHRVTGIAMGRAYEPDEYVREALDVERVSELVRSVRALGPATGGSGEPLEQRSPPGG